MRKTAVVGILIVAACSRGSSLVVPATTRSPLPVASSTTTVATPSTTTSTAPPSTTAAEAADVGPTPEPPAPTTPPTTEPAPAVLPETPVAIRAASALTTFDSCEPLLDHLKAEGLKRVGPYGLEGLHGPVVMGGPRPAQPTGGAPASAGPADSGTTSGGGASGGSTSAGSAPAPAAEESASPQFSGTNVQEAGVDEPDIVKTDGRRLVALNADRLSVVDLTGAAPELTGRVQLGFGALGLLLVGDRALVLGQNYTENAASTSVTVVDLATMTAVSNRSLEGGYVSARLIGGVARIVTTAWPSGLHFVYPADDSEEARREAAETNRRVIERSSPAQWLPESTPCNSVYRPVEFSGFGNVTVYTIDPADPSPRPSASVFGDGHIVYASPRNLYVATMRWEPGAQEVSQVHKFDITDPAGARYLASGVVAGHLLNQWAMSERDDHLRVASTLGMSESFLTVLGETEGALVPVGKVGGLGRNERIYATRCIGALCYVVTFRQVDPLYVIDVSDPTAPAVKGELKIAGYSAYLHPVGDGLLLGVGQDATEEGLMQGTQVSLFDVSDPANPTRLHQHKLGERGTQSEAEFDHHAFLWWAPANLTVLPISRYENEYWTGAVGMTVDAAAGIAERGELTHNGVPIRRSLVVNDRLYTVSDSGVLASDLSSFADRGWAGW